MIDFRLFWYIIVPLNLYLRSDISFTMGPRKCYYINCFNTNETKSLFKFPVNDEQRLNIWIKHLGNTALESQTQKELQQRFLCQDHFEPKDVHKSAMRNRILSTAVPIMFICPDPISPDSASRSSGSVRSRRAGRHARVPFTASQAAALEAAYTRAPYLAPPALKALAAALQLRDDRIKIWFQNRRARERREKTTVISPPQGVTLPPTAMASNFPSNTWISQTNLDIRNAPFIFNTYSKFNRPNGVANDKCISSHTVVSQMYSNPTNFDTRGSPCFDAINANEEDRPGTPLDIET